MKHFLLYLLVMGSWAETFTEEELEMLEDLRQFGLLDIDMKSLLGDDIESRDNHEEEKEKEDMENENGEILEDIQKAEGRGGPYRRKKPEQRRVSKPTRSFIQIVTNLLGTENNGPKPTLRISKPANPSRKPYFRLPVAKYGDYYKPVYIPFRKKKKKKTSFINPEIVNKLKRLYEEQRSSISKMNTTENSEEISDRQSENIDNDDEYGSPKEQIDNNVRKPVRSKITTASTNKQRPVHSSVYKLKPNQRPVSKLTYLNKPSNHIEASTFNSGSTKYKTKPLQILNAVYKTQSTYTESQNSSDIVHTRKKDTIKPTHTKHKVSQQTKKYPAIPNILKNNSTKHTPIKQWVRLRPVIGGNGKINKQDLYKTTFFTNLLEKDPNTHHYPVTSPIPHTHRQNIESSPPTTSTAPLNQYKNQLQKPETLIIHSSTAQTPKKSNITPVSKQYNTTPVSKHGSNTFTPKPLHITTVKTQYHNKKQSDNTNAYHTPSSTQAPKLSKFTPVSPQFHSTHPSHNYNILPSQPSSSQSDIVLPSLPPSKHPSPQSPPSTTVTHPPHTVTSPNSSSTSLPPPHPSITKNTTKIRYPDNPRKRMTHHVPRLPLPFHPTVSELWEDFLVLEERRRKAEKEKE